MLVNGEWRSFADLAEASRHWPRTGATVLESRVSRNSGIRVSRDGRTELVIRYEYDVEGRRYVGDRVQFKTPTESEIENWVKYYPQGAEITVSYLPEDPRASVIVPG